jgi:hypothetical protein
MEALSQPRAKLFALFVSSRGQKSRQSASRGESFACGQKPSRLRVFVVQNPVVCLPKMRIKNIEQIQGGRVFYLSPGFRALYGKPKL